MVHFLADLLHNFRFHICETLLRESTALDTMRQGLTFMTKYNQTVSMRTTPVRHQKKNANIFL